MFTDEAGEWRWHRKAANGEIISSGESHPRKSDALDAAVRANPDHEYTFNVEGDPYGGS